MKRDFTSNQLIVPIYINEKIVLDMLAIMEDGFSTVSQVNYTKQKEASSSQEIGASASSSLLLSKLLKVNLSAGLSHTGNTEESKNIVTEKVHTNVSLLSKFRSFLVSSETLKCNFDTEHIKIGDFIEIEGELQKNPLINCLEMFVDLFNLVDIFTANPQSGSTTQVNPQNDQMYVLKRQFQSFTEQLKHTGTIDFILSDVEGTIVLSVQEQYLSNDNISEIIGGRFKLLGKVISVCKDNTQHIDLLRKTSLSILPKTILEDMFSAFKTKDFKQFNLPELITEISGPAIIVIPIAIYA